MSYLLDKDGNKLVLFHGTNRIFTEHDSNKNRTILNENYQGDWICYSANKDVGWKYSKAARNQCFDKADFLEETNKVFLKIDQEAADFMIQLSHDMMDNGYEKGWDKSIKSFRLKHNIDEDKASYEFFQYIRKFEETLDFDINDFCNCLESVEYSKMRMHDSLNEVVSMFGGGGNSGFTHSDIEMLKNLGYEKVIPEERVLESNIKANNILETKSREEAKNARENGYDLVIYSGVDCVDNEPEYLIADSSQIEIIAVNKKVEKVEYDEFDYCDYTYYEVEREEIEPNINKNKKTRKFKR